MGMKKRVMIQMTALAITGASIALGMLLTRERVGDRQSPTDVAAEYLKVKMREKELSNVLKPVTRSGEDRTPAVIRGSTGDKGSS